MPNGVADKGCGQFSLYDVFLGGREDLQTHYYGLAAAKVYIVLPFGPYLY